MSRLKHQRHSRRVLLKTGPVFLTSFAIAACSRRFSGISSPATEPLAQAQNLPSATANGDVI
ncbi:MAG: hypothetical protein AAF609_23970 [Cyanobacteria bacterium P01_C01_bin.120]